MSIDILQPDPDLVSVTHDFFAELAQRIRNGEQDFRSSWSQTSQLGFTLVGADESIGGSGGTLQDSLAVLHAAAYHAIPLPLGETALAAWLLKDAGGHVPAGPLSVAPKDATDEMKISGGTATGVVANVPWGSHVDRVLAIVGSELALIDPKHCKIQPGHDLAGQPRDTLVLDDVAVETVPAPVPYAEFFWRGALTRATQIAGSLAAVDRQTRRYTKERVQFGKPIAAFQSVQHHIVNVAQAAECAAMSVWRAAAAVNRRNASFECCAAKLTANENARVAARSAHQAHGAIGVTQEFTLHHLTRRLNTWRFDFGTERELSQRLGHAVSEAQSFARCISDHDNEVNVPCEI